LAAFLLLKVTLIIPLAKVSTKLTTT